VLSAVTWLISILPCTGNELFVSHKDFGLEALVAEVYGGTDEPASYFGVGIVKASQCGTGDGQFTGKNSASLEVRVEFSLARVSLARHS